MTAASVTPAWIDISSPDAARARRFYQGLLGWTVELAPEGGYALVGSGGPPGGGIAQSGPGSPYVGLVAYFRVADLEAALSRAVALGGTRRLSPQPVPGGERMALLGDPDGNVVGLLGP